MNKLREIKNGVLYFDGCSMVDLAKEYGTPLYVMSENDIRGKLHEIQADFLNKYPNTRAAYASKAFCTMAMYKICEQEGMCIDIVSGGELYTAIKAGFPAERIEFNGNNKQPQEIADALDYGIGRFIVDGLQEVALIEKICEEKGKKANVLFRVTPGVAASTHDYITTGKKDSKFGIPLDDDVFFPQVEAAIKAEHINFLGLHFHVGSQLFDNAPFLQALDIILGKAAEIKKRFGFDIKELNLGGGFGAIYTDEERKPYAYFLDPMMKKIEEFAAEQSIERPAVVIEPGRSVVAEAGLSLYTIGSIKDIRDIRKYVSIDGGMGDNIRPALYQAEYEGLVANKALEEKDDKVTICGKCCESGDILIKDCMVPSSVCAGDLFAIFSTGAYGYSMAMTYNSNPIPAVVLVKDGKSELIVKRQSYENMISNQVMPEMLK
jgi:diaminopimelate decarboxylase